ncbi:MAG TPA: acetyl-CoA C-acyltransferase [Chloroflexota bacterium]|jgi:acetyl-CoA C-acetyltransferase
MNADSVVIVGSMRTPIGAFQGDLKDVRAPELGAAAIRAAVERSGVAPETVDEVVMGCVLSAGLGQAPARQASLAAGLPLSAGCTTVNKMCGSGMKAIMQAHDSLVIGSADVCIAGGFESMSNAPYLLPKARSGYRMGHGQIVDHMFLDGLEDAYEPGRLMGTYAEDCAQAYEFSREVQDEFAIRSLTRARTAIESRKFEREVASVGIDSATVETDELPLKAKIEGIPKLRPAFRKEGTVTAASSSAISDGAAAVVLMRRLEAEARGLRPLARIVAHATHSQESARFTTAPIGAMRKVLTKAGWDKDEVDLYEINEAFAVVTMAAMQDLDLPADKVNVHGGACALGHPIGASGARIVVTLLSALETYDLRRGVASLCIGGGEATAIAVERLS